MERLQEAPPASSEEGAEPVPARADAAHRRAGPVGLVLLLLAMSEPASAFWMDGVERLVLASSGVLAWVIAFCLHPREEPPEP